MKNSQRSFLIFCRERYARWLVVAATAFFLTDTVCISQTLPPAVPAPPIRTPGEPAVVAILKKDLETLDKGTRPFVRYFVFDSVHNPPKAPQGNATPIRRIIPVINQHAALIEAVSKLVNSLSWSPIVTKPQLVDNLPSAVRIDLRDYGWESATWEQILENYPYAIIPASELATSLATATDCRLPYVRADWFVHTASRPPLYHLLIGLPETDKELESKLRVNVQENIKLGRAARSGFARSQISTNNRLIERHETRYGAYWKSYDFSRSTGRANLFVYPIGPGVADGQFQQDGGEIIFSLPNGLQGYMLVNEKGKRIDAAPITIVRDFRGVDPVVVNGISCMQCHQNGMETHGGNVVDQIRTHITSSSGVFKAEEINSVASLHRPPEAFGVLMQKDAERFLKALASTRAQEGQPIGVEAVSFAANRYGADMDASTVASELCGELKVVEEKVRRSPELYKLLGGVMQGSSLLKRNVFEENYIKIAEKWGLGVRLPNKTGSHMTDKPVAEESGYQDAGIPDRHPTTPQSHDENEAFWFRPEVSWIILVAALASSGSVVMYLIYRPIGRPSPEGNTRPGLLR